MNQTEPKLTDVERMNITSAIDFLNSSTDFLNPSKIAVLCAATPSPFNAILCFSASANFILIIFSASPFCSSFAAPSPLGRTAAEELQTGASCLRGKRLILFYSWSLSLGYRFLRPPAGPLYIDAQNKGSSGCFIGQHRRP